jgi:ectoine hydroxylase-related dioxygenase (phytanoyl-CoA dioxygenase family)
MTTVLSTRRVEQYDRDGVVFPVRVFSTEQASKLRVAVERIANTSGGGLLKRLDSLHLYFGWAYELVTHEPLLNAVEDILGGDILIDGTLVFYKPPRDSSYVSWHQDSVYSGWHLTPSTSAWIALTKSCRENGCLRVIPGSHKQGLLSHVNVEDNSNLLRRGERLAVVDESQAQDVILQPGEMSLHQSSLVHGSNPNSSDEPRIGFIVRFVTSRISQRDRPLLRVRGEGDCRHLTLASPPMNTDPESALANWRRFCRAPGGGILAR